MNRAIISLDTDHIKKYVFATGVLKEIRGASAILDELNRKDMWKIVKEVDSSAECIFANGGSAMFEVEIDKAQTCICKIEKLYHLKTITGSVSGAFLDCSNNDGDFGKQFKILGYRLRNEKSAKASLLSPVTHSFFRPCDSCGEEYASYMEQEEEVICTSCYKKREKDRQIKKKISLILSGKDKSYGIDETDEKCGEMYGIWDWLLYKLIEDPNYDTKDKKRAENFEQLGRLSKPQDYIGLLYADGNGMGAQLTDLEIKEELRDFSTIVDRGIRMSVMEAIKKHLQPRDKTFPFDILFLGGDDLVMTTVADKAVETAIVIANTFREYTCANLGKPLELSLGVAIAHAKFPFGNFLDMAEDLLKFAKKESAIRARNDSSIDKNQGLINFQVVNASSSLNFSKDYKKVFVSEEVKKPGKSPKFIRTLRPYAAKTMDDDIVNKIKYMKAFPKNKLQALREAVFMDYGNSVLQGLVIQNRLKTEQKRFLQKIFDSFSGSQNIEPLPWYKQDDAYYTPFLDIAELYDFIQ